MKKLRVAALVLAALVARGEASAQARDVPTAVWPDRVAVGMRSGGQLPPIVVEATKTGWVSLTLLSSRQDANVTPPIRLVSESRDLRVWIKGLRSMLAAMNDSSVRLVRFPFTLGYGALRLSVAADGGRTRGPTVTWRGCGSVNGYALPSVDEMASLVELLDSAATIAGDRAGRPPTLSRPYYSSDVSCPANGDETNARPIPPASVPEVVTEVAVQFVVDTAGLVERNSIRVLPQSNRALVDSVRSAIARWRYRPSEIDGIPVRQVVQTTIAVSPRPTQSGVHIVATSDGWVHVRRGDPSNRGVVQEWFDPDSVDAFVSRLNALNREADSLPKDTNIVRQKNTTLGSAPGPVFTAGFFRHGKVLDRTATLAGCGGSAASPTTDPVPVLVAVAQQARQHGAPVDPASAADSWNDVACPATLKTPGDPSSPFDVWRYAVGAFPASMRGMNVRFDVMASFVVDTTGAVEANTIEAMPGSDPRVVAELASTLSTFLFRPALRSGRKVRQRVFQTIRFEPPPICLTPRANPSCSREYSPR